MIQKPKAKTDKRKGKLGEFRKKPLTPEQRRKSILELGDFSDDGDSDSTSVSTPGRGRRRSPRQSRDEVDSDSGRRSLSSKRRNLLRSVAEEEEEDSTEDYWFFVDNWFARSEGDGLIVRELIPTDKHGKPLKGTLEGNCLTSFYLSLYTTKTIPLWVFISVHCCVFFRG